jgi:hypothetical protein
MSLVRESDCAAWQDWLAIGKDCPAALVALCKERAWGMARILALMRIQTEARQGRKIVAHGVTVGSCDMMNSAPEGVKETLAR